MRWSSKSPAHRLSRCIEKTRSETKTGDPQTGLRSQTLQLPDWRCIYVHRYQLPIQKKPGTDRLLSSNFKLAQPLEGLVMRMSEVP